MCGIISHFGKYSNKKIIEETDIIKYRGQDDTQYLFLDNFGCGFVRLSILDIKNGSQPISNEDNTIFIICNGEIYNYKYLNNMLRNNKHIFKTNSDVEVILHLYEEYGVKCINHLEGMYAFLIYDSNKNRVIAGRDHIGIKPLFYRVNIDNIQFSSELKVFKNNIYCNQSLLEKEVFGFVLNPELTIYKNIKQVKPGQVISIDYPRVDKIQKYEASYNCVNSDDSLEKCLLNSIESHLINSDVDVGVSLSGGVDSSLIAILCKEIKSDIRTFTISNRKNSSDIYYANLLAKKYGFKHTEIIIDKIPKINNLDYILDYILTNDLSGTFDNIGDLAVLLFYKEVSKYVKVMLSGDGCDELFGGYWMHKKPLGYKDKLKLRCNDEKFKMRLDSIFPENDEIKGRKNALDILFNSALPNYHLWTLDRCSMKYGIEARVPYLDINVINNVMNKNPKERINKKLLKELHLKYLPIEIINRDKEGFCNALKKK